MSQVTMKELAKRLGTSVSTVSRALQNHPRIGLKMREDVMALAKELNYSPNTTAINLKKQSTKNVGVVVPWLTEQFFSMAITGIEDILFEKGYRVVLQQSRDDFEREEQAIQALMKHGVDGIIVSMGSGTYNHRHFLEVNRKGIPLVFFDRVVKSLPNSCVYTDITQASFEAVELLLNKGLTKIALLNGPNTMQSSNERLMGYVNALKLHEIELNPIYIKTTDLSFEDTFKKTHELLDLTVPPQAIFAFHDYMSLDAMQIAKERGLIINQDIFFVSFSNLSFCKYLEKPPFASIEQFPYEMGAKAANLLVDAMKKPDDYVREEVIIRSKLIVRV